MVRKLFSAVAVCVALVSPTTTQAQETSSDWKQTVFIYGMGAAIDGTAEIGPLELPVDMSISDLFDALDFGAMAAYRVENGVWSFEGDVTYMNLGVDQTGPREKVRGELDTEQLTVMATAGRRISPYVEGLFSLAYFNLSNDLEVQVLNQRARASRERRPLPGPAPVKHSNSTNASE